MRRGLKIVFWTGRGTNKTVRRQFGDDERVHKKFRQWFHRYYLIQENDTWYLASRRVGNHRPYWEDDRYPIVHGSAPTYSEIRSMHRRIQYHDHKDYCRGGRTSKSRRERKRERRRERQEMIRSSIP